MLRWFRGAGKKLQATLLLSLFFLLMLLFVVVCAIPHSVLIAPVQTLILEDRDGRFLAELQGDSRAGYGYWDIKDWPERVIRATLVLEDRRFWSHPGVDIRAIFRAALQNITHRQRISGASTIAMQIVRMQNPVPRTYYNKAIEAAAAIIMTMRYERKDIILHYLKRVPYANQIHGISYAAYRYYKKPVNDLSWAEIAFLSAIPQSPTLHNPLRVEGKVRAKKRALRILQGLQKQALISEAQFELATNQLEIMDFPLHQNRPREAMHAILKMRRILRRAYASEHAPSSPLIHSSLSLKLQKRVHKIVNHRLAEFSGNGANNIAAVVIENKSDDVLVWLGASDYFDGKQGEIDFIQKPRSPGSTLKPFIYALGLDRGVITPATVMADLPALSRGISNSDKRFLGPLLPRQALANSRNIPAINLLRKLGAGESYAFLGELGLHDGSGNAGTYGSGMVIGTLPTSLEQLMRSYSVFVNDGYLQALNWFDEQFRPRPARLLSADAARQISLFLADPMAKLPGYPRMGTTEYPFPAAVKTGTSQGYRDAWTIAYTPEYRVGVWVGRDDARPMRKLSGAGSAAVVAKDIMLDLYSRQSRFDARTAFRVPDAHTSYILCALSGKLANDLCTKKQAEWLSAQEQPEMDNTFVERFIDRRNGLMAGQWTPEKFVEKSVFVQLPFMFHEWAKSKGYKLPPEKYSLLDNSNSDFNDDVLAPSKQALQISLSEMPVKVRILSPENYLHVLKNPEVPEAQNTLAFNLDVQGGIREVLWYVDKKPYKLKSAPYTLRWPLKKGQHEFYAEVPFLGVVSNRVTVVVD
ncbi:MAG TPA: glycosyl transferase [Gammaproteobacteria bacterium]|nr:glycosyl transferase [Gammaproteobacteria bacterium]